MSILKQVFYLVIILCTLLTSFEGFANELLDGRKGLRFTESEAQKLTVKATAGNGKACFCLSLYYFLDDNKRLYWLKKGVEYGDDEAEFFMSEKYMYSFFWFRRKAGLVLLIKSAAKGNENAQMSLGDLYKKGELVNKDLKQAEYWYRMSAMSSGESSMVRLAELIMENTNDTPRLIEAYSWTILAMNRSKGFPGLARMAEELQEQIIVKVKKLSYDRSSFLAKAQSLATAEEKKIAFPKERLKRCKELAR